MWIWRHVSGGLRSLFRREAVDQELDDEVRHFMDEAIVELVASGATPEEARRTVRLQYGDALSAREDVRAYGWETFVEALQADLRLSARRLRRSPGFTTVVILTLGLGTGSATAIFSAVSPVLLHPLPYPDADRILSVSDRADDGSLVAMAFGTYWELAERTLAFEALSVFKPWQPTMTWGDEPRRLEAQRVSAGFFDVLGVTPILGPGFEASADRPGGRNLVVMSDDLWRISFGSDPGIVGQVIQLDSESFEVVGVMAPAFENVVAPRAQAWSLLQYDPLLPSMESREWGHHLGMIGRSRAGVGLDEARRALDGIGAQPVPEFNRPEWAHMQNGFSVRLLRDATMAGARPTMLILSWAVAMLLVIACVNLTILALARGARRRSELALRAALGAGRGRLIRQLLTESLLLAALGGVFGIVVAQFGIAALVALSPASLPGVESITLDRAALGFALVLTTLVGVIVGLAPGLRPGVAPKRSPGRASGKAPSGPQLSQALGDTARGSVGGSHSARRALVITEVAVAVILLVGAGLLLRSTQRLFSTPPGFDPAQLVVMQVYTTGLERGDANTHSFFDQALEAVRNVPGVREAVLTNQLPLSGDIEEFGVTLNDTGGSDPVTTPAYRYGVTPGYFETMGMRLVRGRGLETRDISGATPVTVVSESLANRLFPGGDPVGARLQIGGAVPTPYTIVGVVGDVKQVALGADQTDAIYVTSHQWHWADAVRWIVVQAERDPVALVPAVRRAIWSVDSNQPIVRPQSMANLVAQSESQRQFVLIVLTAFALLALTLAGIGLYGVLSGSVAERMREIGVRAALGASRENILALVVRQGMAWTTVGVVIGLAGAAAASQALVTLLFGVSRLDPMTYLAVVTLLALVSLVACGIPAARAARVDPLSTLRSD